MFGIEPSEFLLIAIVALVVIGPKDLPKAMRFVGKWVGQARGVARQFRSGFDAMVREAELEEMEKKWAAENERIMREHPSTSIDHAADRHEGEDAAPETAAKPQMLPLDEIAVNPAALAPGAPEKAGRMTSEIDASRAPLLDHLIELRKRLLYCILAIGLAFAVAMYFSEQIFGFLVQPLLRAGQGTVIYTQIFEAFFVQVKVAFFASMMISFPVIANQLWQFVAPGLYKKERRALLPFLFATPVLFIGGAAMAYYIAVPMALHFLLGFDGMVGGIKREALPGVGNYLSFIMQFLFGFGIAFLLPVLLMLLERAGVVTRKQLISARRYAIVASFAIAAVLTPPDIGSQMLLAIPLCILYEAALIGIWFTERGRAREAAKEQTAGIEEP